MWVSKRLDFSWRDLGFGLGVCCVPGRRRASARQVEGAWSERGDALACLSVRSGFDLVLAASRFDRSSEIVFSALTISDMPAIAEQHGLIPIPMDVDGESTAARVDELRRAVTAQTKAIVVTHLYGGRSDIGPIIEVARERGILVIEDCAQAFAGLGYTGHPESDVTMFSFGPIKTSTALGGALLCVRRADLLTSMRELQLGYPVQPTRSYAARLMKYGVLRSLSGPRVYGAICRAFGTIGLDHDRIVHGLTRSFEGKVRLRRYRRQPCGALLRLLHRRLLQDRARLDRRVRDGADLLRQLGSHVVCPGATLDPHYHWVFPVLADRPTQLIDALRRAGFDATEGRSLAVVQRASGRAHGENANARAVQSRTVFVPFYPEMTAAAWDRMAAVVNEAACVPASDSVLAR